MILRGAVWPAALYTSEVWGGRGRDSRIRKGLKALQRPFLLAITGAYRTAPSSALEVLAGVPPLHLEALRRSEVWEGRGRGVDERRVSFVRRDAWWQEEWDRGVDGRSLFSVLGVVSGEGMWCLSPRAVWLLTGHGPFNCYYARFRLRQTDGLCECGAAVDDVTHVLYQCLIPRRVQGREIWERFRGGEVVLSGQEEVQVLNQMAEAMVYEYDSWLD